MRRSSPKGNKTKVLLRTISRNYRFASNWCTSGKYLPRVVSKAEIANDNFDSLSQSVAMTFTSNYLKALPLRGWLCLLSIWISVLFLTLPTQAMAQAPLEVGANTTVFFADTLNSLVWEDKSGKASLEDVRGKLTDFKPADAFQSIDPKSHYWVAQRLVNRLGENREIVVNASINKEGIHWLRYQHFVRAREWKRSR